jgi:hypothetical protein
VPGEDGVGCDNRGHVRQGFLPQLLTDLGQRCAFASRQPHTARDLVTQEAMLCHQILVTQEEFLVD